MAKKRIDKRGRRKLETRVQFLVEGDTEEYYFKSYLKDIKYQIKISIDNLKGGGYKAFLDKIYKNRSLYDVIIVITDLDRARELREKESLIKLIKLLQEENNRNNIFLTFKNIEDWQKATLNLKGKNFNEYLGYSGKTKGQPDIYARIKNKGGSFENATGKFKEENLFFIKKDFNKGLIIESNLMKNQSNLIYFKEYLNQLEVLN
jgi:hypothetical protein